MQRMTSILTIAALLCLASIPAMPLAAAHTCTVEKGEPTESDCNKACREGEDHKHKVTHHHENGIEEDVDHTHFECSSSAEAKDPCPVPSWVGVCSAATAAQNRTRASVEGMGLSPG